VCTLVTALIVTVPGLVRAGACGTEKAAATTVTAVLPTSFAATVLIATVPPSSANRRIVPMREERVDELDLLDWKRHVFALYAGVRAAGDPEFAWRGWRAARDELFRSHPQSPLPAGARDGFGGLAYFDYDPALRVLAEVEPAEEARILIAGSGEEPTPFRRFASAVLELGGEPVRLALYWLGAYGGGGLPALGGPPRRRGDHPAGR